MKLLRTHTGSRISRVAGPADPCVPSLRRTTCAAKPQDIDEVAFSSNHQGQGDELRCRSRRSALLSAISISLVTAAVPQLALAEEEAAATPVAVSTPEVAVAEPEPVNAAAAAPAPAAPAPAVSQAQVVYLDVKLEGKPLGRIQVELFPDVTVGSARFRDLAVGKRGVGYRLSRFDGIFPTYIRCEGVKSLSYSADMESPITGGDNIGLLEAELQQQARRHDSAGLVSLIVSEATERRIQEKLIARDGKLVTVTTQLGEAPNATTFVITRGADPSLDPTNLIVGRVVGGTEVVDAIAALPFARPRDSYYDGPFFAAAKAMGDKRADTAEKGFNRPLKRVIVSGGGLV